MGFGEAIRTCLGKYAVFSGRARRSEYWYFILFGVLLGLVTSTLEAIIAAGSPNRIPLPLSSIASLALLLPNLGVTVRRLHDTNRSGWWLGGYYIYAVGAVIAGVAAFFTMGHETFAGPFAIFAVVLILVFVAYGIWLFVLTVLPGTQGTNDFGPDPLAPNVDVF